jgi:drug/metabolite transporter (DMT)-like permease
VRDLRGDAGATTTVLTWAAAFPAIRVGLDGYSPWALALFRLLVAGAALAAFRPARPGRRHIARIVVCGLVGQTLYQGLLMTGEVTVPAGTASLLIVTAPIFSVLSAAALLHEPIGRRWKGFLVAFAGAALVGGSLGVGGGASVLIVLAAALCQGLYHVAIKPLAEQLGALAATAWSVWAGAALALPAFPALLAGAHTAPAGSTISALFLGIVPSAVGYMTWSYALTRASVARTTVALYLVPVVAMALSWAWLGEAPTPLAVVGGVLAMVGVILVRRVPATPATPPPARVSASAP